MAYSVVVSTSKGSTDNTIATTAAVNTTGADAIFIVYSSFSNGGAPTDSKGNTYTKVTDSTIAATAYCALYYCQAPTVGASHTFSSANLAGTYPTINVLAVSGSIASPLDQFSAANAKQAGSVTPTLNNEIIIAGACTWSAGGTADATAIDSGFTLSTHIAEDNPINHYGGGLAYLIQTSAGAVNPLWTTGGTANIAVIGTFKGSAGTTGSMFSIF